MIVDPESISASAMYQFMIGVVVPRPIAFVTTVSAAGRVNAAPFSFYNAISGSPPLVGISINHRAGQPKHTLANLRATRDFVVNSVSEELAARMVRTSGDWPEEIDELALVGLTAVPSDKVKPPRIAEAPASFECRLEREIELGQTTFVIGEIVRAHVSDAVLTEGRVDVEKLKPLGRLGGNAYSLLGEVLRLSRPVVSDQGVEAPPPGDR